MERSDIIEITRAFELEIFAWKFLLLNFQTENFGILFNLSEPQLICLQDRGQ